MSTEPHPVTHGALRTDTAFPTLGLDLLRAIDKQSSAGADFLKVRERALQQLSRLPPLNSTHELWRYTTPDQFSWEVLTKPSRMGLSCLPLTIDPKNGSLSGAGELPSGVSVQDSFSGQSELLEELFTTKATDLADNVAAQFQLALVSNISLIIVSKKFQNEKPLLLSQLLSNGTSGGFASLVVVVLERDTKAVFIEDLDWQNFSGLYAPRVEFVLRDNASLEFVSIQALSEECHYLGRHRFHLARDARLKTVHVALGGKVARLDLDCCLREPGAHADLFGLYLAAGDQHLDYHSTQSHLAPHCRSELYYKGALMDTARSVYFGYIRVAEAAQKTDAYQTNRNLLLSPDARADAIPNLEIKANDVKCSHGASVGQVGSEELFYLMARGLPREIAERLLVEGFFADLMNKISDEWTRTFVSQAVLERLHRRQES